ncbi:MAG: zf-HC2 domain-containing protein [Alphaproteobacteria bacterium]|nr:zf-HC2 domain-containing protein [Alphaproteobacteria bacterium]
MSKAGQEPIRRRRRLHGMMFRLPLMITCEAFEDFILAYLEGDLNARQTFVFELHLKLCRECRDYLDAYRKALELAKACGSDEAAVLQKVPEDLVAAVLAARDC